MVLPHGGGGWLRSVHGRAGLGLRRSRGRSSARSPAEPGEGERQAAAVTEERGAEDEADAATTAATMRTTLRISEPSSIGARSRPSSGTNSQKAPYTSRPAPPKNVSTASSTRMIVGSMSRWRPRLPATGEVTVGGAAAQPAHVAHLLRADAGAALAGRVAGGVAGRAAGGDLGRAAGGAVRRTARGGATAAAHVNHRLPLRPRGIGEGPDSSGPNVRGVT